MDGWKWDDHDGNDGSKMNFLRKNEMVASLIFKIQKEWRFIFVQLFYFLFLKFLLA
jgi:hypothetical protein